MGKILNHTGHWLLLFLVMDGIFAFALWLLMPEAAGRLALLLVLFSLMAVAVGVILDGCYRRRVCQALSDLLREPTLQTCQALTAALGPAWAGEVEALYGTLSELSNRENQAQLAKKEYQDYMESWVHEMKTPLSLETLVLENHCSEMSQTVAVRMGHAHHLLVEGVDRILYYARLQADHVDLRFSMVPLERCAEEALDAFQAAAQERGVMLTAELEPVSATTDEAVLIFLLSQLLGNGVKYAPEGTGKVVLRLSRQAAGPVFTVQDNGPGAAAEDLPFLFDKGFAGSAPNRRKATGMGLYLVSKYARRLGLSVGIDPSSTEGSGFSIWLRFPQD